MRKTQRKAKKKMKRRAAKMARKRRIDVNDIIGQVFNGMKVNKCVGDKKNV